LHARRTVLVLALAAATLVPALAACAPTTGSGAGGSASDPGQLIAEKCSRCHPLQRVQAARKDQAGWSATVDRMTTHGLQVTDAEKTAIVGYLVANQGR